MEYISVNEAKSTAGLRLVLTQGNPGPWGEAAKSIFHVKNLPFAAAAQFAGMENEELREWTGQTSAPVAIYNNEQPRTGWMDILYLAERLQPVPSLIPDETTQRAMMFGLSREIAGEQGFGWCRRLIIFKSIIGMPGLEEIADRLCSKYGYNEVEAAQSITRAAKILRTLSEWLLLQRKKGSCYFIGEQLSALDIYWASFSNMLQPLPAEQNPMPEQTRMGYQVQEPEILAAVDPILLEHRDYIYNKYLQLPLDF